MTKQILTTTILLLSLFTYATAQNRSDKEALEGLREMDVIVKYSNADGIEAALQPTILRMLQDRARQRLWEAEMPMLQSTNKEYLAGRPRLIFTVTATKPSLPVGPNKSTAHRMATIYIQASLFERVRLLRDPGKEMELATWVQGGIGMAESVTQKMLLQVFDGIVDEFVTEYREVNPNVNRVEEVTPKTLKVKDDANSLQGLNGIKVFVWFQFDSRIHPPELAEFEKKFQPEAEKRFKEAGIPLRGGSTGANDQAGDPLLYIAIKTRPPKFLTYSPSIEVMSDFWQYVRPVRDSKKQTYAVTWESRDSGEFEETDNGAPAIIEDAVQQVLNRQIDEFIKAYNAANPKPPSPPNGKAQ